ncbi:MAG: phosphoribosylamine--glycine ligase [Sandaracinaceae bacterium]
MTPFRILIIGEGAREHALGWRLSRSDAPRADIEVIFAPGNAGTARVGRNVSIRSTDLAALVDFARSEAIGLVIVGPEAPLVAGLTDALREAGIPVFGPSRQAARLEGSKAFAKSFMERHRIPTASHQTFDDPASAKAFVRAADRPVVVKADGLAAGKGVVVASDVGEALAAIDTMMIDRAHGDAGARLVIEERLTGPEISFHALCDGERYVALAPAQDHKRLEDGDAGPNTGGMGAYSPPPFAGPELARRIEREVIEPTLLGMAREGSPFRGALFVGLMIEDGEPKVLEYNVRFGDPETEVLMRRLGGDALALFRAVAAGDLGEATVEWDAPSALGVVMASAGYPGAYAKGLEIEGIDAADAIEDVVVFEAGTAVQGGKTVTHGGRVLCVTASGRDIDQAALRAYEGVSRIRFEGAQIRTDIGWQARATLPPR